MRPHQGKLSLAILLRVGATTTSHSGLRAIPHSIKLGSDTLQLGTKGRYGSYLVAGKNVICHKTCHTWALEINLYTNRRLLTVLMYMCICLSGRLHSSDVLCLSWSSIGCWVSHWGWLWCQCVSFSMISVFLSLLLTYLLLNYINYFTYMPCLKKCGFEFWQSLCEILTIFRIFSLLENSD